MQICNHENCPYGLENDDPFECPFHCVVGLDVTCQYTLYIKGEV